MRERVVFGHDAQTILDHFAISLGDRFTISGMTRLNATNVCLGRLAMCGCSCAIKREQHPVASVSMSAYGRNHCNEQFFGGTTEKMIGQQEFPVLLTHQDASNIIHPTGNSKFGFDTKKTIDWTQSKHGRQGKDKSNSH